MHVMSVFTVSSFLFVTELKKHISSAQKFAGIECL